MLPAGFVPQDVHDQRFRVEFDYPVVFVDGALAPEEPALAWAIARREPERRHPSCFVLDGGLVAAQPELPARVTGYAARHSGSVELRAEPLIVPGGEACKNDAELVPRLLETFARLRLDRQASVIAIGGGAVLDAVGYAASVTHRGLRLVRVPSTVLSQCDGGVGVKTSVNGFAAKNFVGTFAPPHAVVDDFALLRSLPLRDARAGMAEAVKVALIRDPEFFAWLEAHAPALSRAEAAPLASLVRRCAALHLAHIREGGDPFETGSARPLDYGHWAAHKLEIISGHELRHGEAVAIGMLLDARYAERSGLLASADLERILELLGRLGLPRYHAALAEESAGRLSVLRGLEDFREHLGGALSVTLLEGIGRSREIHDMDAARVEEAIGWLRERAERA
ncbi:MAG TPA: 3-dehydroquinate synthase [Polyangiaceae bacterium]